MRFVKLAAVAALSALLMGCGGSSDDEGFDEGFVDDRPGININFVALAVQNNPVTFNYVPLAASYGGASGQTGVWNEFGVGTGTLLSTAGEMLTATIDTTGFGDLLPPTNEDSMLLANYIRTDSTTAVSVMLSGIEQGQYELYFYSFAAQTDTLANSIAITLAGGDEDQLGNDGENWTSVTVDVGADGTLSITDIASLVSGIQLVPVN